MHRHCQAETKDLREPRFEDLRIYQFTLTDKRFFVQKRHHSQEQVSIRVDFLDRSKLKELGAL